MQKPRRGIWNERVGRGGWRAGFDGDEAADLSSGDGGQVTVGVGSTDICVGTNTDGPTGPVQILYEDSVQVESRLRDDGRVETAVG